MISVLNHISYDSVGKQKMGTNFAVFVTQYIKLFSFSKSQKIVHKPESSHISAAISD